MERTASQLEAAHLRLLDLLAEHPSPAAEALARSVPHLVGLVEDRVPHADAVILRREDVRELCLSLVVDTLRIQAAVLRARPRRRASALP
jgi:hypothetical protein